MSFQTYLTMTIINVQAASSELLKQRSKQTIMISLSFINAFLCSAYLYI